MNTKIKTVYYRADNRESFDNKVNELLECGWKLGRIELNPSRCENKHSMLFALLFKQQ